MSAQPREVETAGTSGVVHQALRREVNEHISAVAEPELIEVMCECVRAECAAHVTMTLAEYELVRRFPTRFFVKAGHDVAEGERVVAEADGYVVIEASGRGGLYAVSADPRSRYRRREGVGR
jgi:siroheme synthase (precorrin-2 oxidase/ferrochelatase)